LANRDIAPSQTEILGTLERFKQWLQIRNSSPLFRLQTAEQIKNQVRFHNTGLDQIPGLIAMSISDEPEARLDPNYGAILVLWNATPKEVSWELADWELGDLELHPSLVDSHNSQASYDSSDQHFNLPPRSVAVFVAQVPLFATEPETAPDPKVIEPAPESTARSEPTPTPAIDDPELSPTAYKPLPADFEQLDQGTRNLWAYLLGGAVVIVIAVGAWLWMKKK
jgi:hypothetical protein